MTLPLKIEGWRLEGFRNDYLFFELQTAEHVLVALPTREGIFTSRVVGGKFELMMVWSKEFPHIESLHEIVKAISNVAGYPESFEACDFRPLFEPIFPRPIL